MDIENRVISQNLIDSIEELKQSISNISVYDLNFYSMTELYYNIAKKINEIIKECYRYEVVVSEEIIKQNECLQYLLNDGLINEVINKINEMVADGTMDTIINHNIFNELNVKIKNIGEREYISLDTFGDTQEAYQQCFDYCNDNGIGILIPSKTFYINEPIILKEQGTYYIKGCNTNFNDGSNVKSKSVLIPSTILFKGERIDDNTTVYITLENVRIMPQKGVDGYAKSDTYVFYNLNLFGLNINNVTCRHIDVFCQGYVSKCSVIKNSRISFIKTALFRGNSFNGAFMADSQITNCYITGSYPVTLFQGTVVNSTISNCFFDFFKYMINISGNKKADGLHFKDNTIGIFYRFFEGDVCKGHVEIIGNKIETCSKDGVNNWSSTNFVNIDSDMETGNYGVFYSTSWINNIYGYETDKCKVHNNRFVSCDNMFTKANSSAQVDIRNNTHNNVSGKTYELSYRKDSLGENASFYCDALDNQILDTLPTIYSSGEYYVFNGQRCIVDNREYVLVDYKWVEISNNNVFSTSATPTFCGTYKGKPLYKRIFEGSIELGSTGFKTPINLSEAEILFVDLSHSYWNEQGQTVKYGFNCQPKTAVVDKSVTILPYDSKKVLMYQQEGATSNLSINYSITVEYTIA